MYGTVAYCRARPGTEKQLMDHIREFEAANVPGAIAVYIYRMHAAANEYYLTVAFENKEAYMANATSPEQDARYQRLLALLQGAPEWHDGEIVYAMERVKR